MDDGRIKKVHFSIDDVGRSLRYLARKRPKSLFDLDLYRTLQEWNKKYGLKVTLYCFAMLDDFLISEIPSVYEKDFSENAEWLRFGFHQKSAVPFRDEGIDGCIAGYNLVNDTLTRMRAGKTNILRLHSWNADPVQKKFLADRGVETLLYPDDDCFRYDEKDEFEDKGLLHRRTRIWFEKFGQEMTHENLFVGQNYIVAFTHERCFLEQANRIEQALQIYKRNEYEFV